MSLKEKNFPSDPEWTPEQMKKWHKKLKKIRGRTALGRYLKPLAHCKVVPAPLCG